jgi:putative chitinase
VFVITAEQLRKAVPHCTDPVNWVRALNGAMAEFGIADNRDYVIEFLAQAAHESGQFTRLEESLNYSASRLAAVWPKRFAADPSASAKVPNKLANDLAGKPHALAEAVYGGRMGNGPVGSGDGWKYRGRGVGMITGKSNYELVAKRLNDPLILSCPDRLCTKDTAARAFAAWWSSDRRLNALALDRLDDDDMADFISISTIVNGGHVGLEARLKLREALKAAMEV